MGFVARTLVKSINRNQKLGITSVITLLIILSSLLTAYMLRLSEVKYKMNCIDPVMRKQEEKLTEWNAGRQSEDKYIWEPGEPLYDYAYKTTEEFLKMNNGCKIGGSILNLTEDETVVFRVSIGFTIAISLYALLLLLSHFDLLGSSYETIRQFNRKEQRRFKQAIMRKENKEARSEYNYDNTDLKVSQIPFYRDDLLKKILAAWKENISTPETQEFTQYILPKTKEDYIPDQNNPNEFDIVALSEDIGTFIQFKQSLKKTSERRKMVSQASSGGAKLVGRGANWAGRATMRGAQRGAQGLRGIFSKGQKEGPVTLRTRRPPKPARDMSGGSDASAASGGSLDSLGSSISGISGISQKSNISAQSPGPPYGDNFPPTPRDETGGADPAAGASSVGVAGYTRMYGKKNGTDKRRQVQSTSTGVGTVTGAGVIPGGANSHAAAASLVQGKWRGMQEKKIAARNKAATSVTKLQAAARGRQARKKFADLKPVDPAKRLQSGRIKPFQPSTGGGAGSSAQPVTTQAATTQEATTGGQPSPVLSPEDQRRLTLLKQKAATEVQRRQRGRQDRILAARKREEAAAAAEAAVEQNLTRARRDVRLQPLQQGVDYTKIPGIVQPLSARLPPPRPLPPIQSGAQTQRGKIRPAIDADMDPRRKLHQEQRGLKQPKLEDRREAPITGPPSPPGTPPPVPVAGPGSAFTQTRTATDLLRAQARAQASGIGTHMRGPAGRGRQEGRESRRLPGTRNVSESPRSNRAADLRAAANKKEAAAQGGPAQLMVGSFNRSRRGAPASQGGLSGSASAPQLPSRPLSQRAAAPQLSLSQEAAAASREAAATGKPMSPQMYDRRFMSV